MKLIRLGTESDPRIFLTKIKELSKGAVISDDRDIKLGSYCG